MRTLVIIAHTNFSESRINRRLADEAAKLGNITVHNLYSVYPDENIDVEREQKLLIDHERFVFQFPFYWYGAPYILKKWQEKVLTYGWAYGPGGTSLKGKEFMIAVSTGGPEIAYEAGGYNSFTMDELLSPFKAMCKLLGCTYLDAFKIHGAPSLSDEALEKGAKEYVQRLVSES